jgi:hypothetical protein
MLPTSRAQRTLYAIVKKPDVMQSPNALMTMKPTMSEQTTIRVPRPCRAPMALGMYQSGSALACVAVQGSQGTAFVSTGPFGSEANARAMRSSSEIDASGPSLPASVSSSDLMNAPFRRCRSLFTITTEPTAHSAMKVRGVSESSLRPHERTSSSNRSMLADASLATRRI